MLDTNINDGDVYTYEQIRLYDPPTTIISLKQINEIYQLCNDAQISKISKSEIFLNISTFSLGLASVFGCFSLNILVIGFALLAIYFYVKYLLARKDDGNNIKKLARDIMNLMPISEDEVLRFTDIVIRADAARIKSFEDHSRSPYRN